MSLENENFDENVVYERQMKIVSALPPDVDYTMARKRPQITSAIAAAFGAFILGYSLGWSSPVQPQLQRNATADDDTKSIWYLRLDDDSMSWVASLINLGAMIAALWAGYLVDQFGRRTVLMMTILPSIIGWLLISTALNSVMLCFGRVFLGFAGGLCYVAGPIYVNEIATPGIRGMLGFTHQVMLSAGLWTASAVALSLVTWRLLSFIALVPTIAYYFLLQSIPESPYFLIKTGRQTQALEVLQRLRGREYDATAEMNQLEAQVWADASLAPRVSDLFQPRLYKPILIGIALMIFQQFSGINAMLFYSVYIFQMAGSSLDGLSCAAILNTVLLISVFTASQLVDRLGRRPLFLISEVFTCVSLLVMGACFYIKSLDLQTSQLLGWLPLTCLVFFIASYAIGVGPLPWLVSSEVLPAKFRGLGGSIVSITNWATSFIVSKTFVDLQRVVTTAGTFWLFGGFCAVGILFGLVILPETKSNPNLVPQLKNESAVRYGTLPDPF